jgi:hypothetical protein
MCAIGVVVEGVVRAGFETPSRKVEFASTKHGGMKDAHGRPARSPWAR